MGRHEVRQELPRAEVEEQYPATKEWFDAHPANISALVSPDGTLLPSSKQRLERAEERGDQILDVVTERVARRYLAHPVLFLTEDSPTTQPEIVSGVLQMLPSLRGIKRKVSKAVSWLGEQGLVRATDYEIVSLIRNPATPGAPETVFVVPQTGIEPTEMGFAKLREFRSSPGGIVFTPPPKPRGR